MQSNITTVNGSKLIIKDDKTIFMTKEEKISKLNTQRTENEFNIYRELGHYIDMSCNPIVCATVQLITPGRKAIGNRYFKWLPRLVVYLEDSIDIGLNIFKLGMRLLQVVGLSETSSASAPKWRGQLLFFIHKAYGQRRANINYYIL